MNIALFASGSSGNCALVSDGETHILIDAGISARRICAGLTAQDVAPADLAEAEMTVESLRREITLLDFEEDVVRPLLGEAGEMRGEQGPAETVAAAG